MSKNESDAEKKVVEDDDEPDEWDKRIFSTGCADENWKLTECHSEKKDWRQCTEELTRFRECWKRHNNDKRTQTKDAERE